MISRSSEEKPDINELRPLQEKKGKPKTQLEEQKLMHSVLESDKKRIDQGHIIIDSINQGIFSFNPDMMMEHLVRNYNLAKQLYGETLLRAITGHDESTLIRNLKIPEFQRELKKRINQNIEELKEDDLIDKDKKITEKGFEIAALTLYKEELDNLIAKGLVGEKKSEKIFHYGAVHDYRAFKKGDRYKDIALKKSIKSAIRKKHSKIEKEDLQVVRRESKGRIYLIYALDASGSMRGNKINLCKKAGVALAFKAIQEHDKVGLIVFGSGVDKVVRPTSDFMALLKEITGIRAKKETNIALTIRKSIEIFPNEKDVTRHLIIITDGLPTTGKAPEEETLEAVNEAIFNGISVSVIGVNLDEKGKALSEKIAQLGQGNLYIARDLKNLDMIVLQDYYSL
ncbi:VWA domain-containing protein [Candidatus Woesearchaeota archaeon]|nr:VWA domain-containing protein [Candidatus Woesearchaeota archaeon]